MCQSLSSICLGLLKCKMPQEHRSYEILEKVQKHFSGGLRSAYRFKAYHTQGVWSGVVERHDIFMLQAQGCRIKLRIERRISEAFEDRKIHELQCRSPNYTGQTCPRRLLCFGIYVQTYYISII